MGEKYFYFAFSTAVVKSSVEPANGHKTTELSRGMAATTPCTQLWSIVGCFAVDLQAHRCKWLFLVADPGPVSPVPGLHLLLPLAANSQTLLSLQCPAQPCGHCNATFPSLIPSTAEFSWEFTGSPTLRYPRKAHAVQPLQLCRDTLTHAPHIGAGM